jgi:hypothetical protein
MASSVGFVAGTLIRWRKRYFVVVDCDGMDTIIGQERGKGGFERIPISEALAGQFVSPAGSCARHTLISGSLGTLVL